MIHKIIGANRSSSQANLLDHRNQNPSETTSVWPAVILIAVMTLGVILFIRNNYFYADSYIVFTFIHSLGLSPNLLGVHIFGHIAPAARFLTALPLQLIPLNWTAGVVEIATLYAWLMGSLNWVLRELRVPSKIALTILVVVGMSPVLFWEVNNFDQTVFLFPASAFMLCTIALYVRWSRTGSLPFLIASWVVFTVSLATQERVLIGLVYLFVLRYLVLDWRPAPIERKSVFSDWRVWLPYAVPAFGYLVYYLGLAPSQPAPLTHAPKFLAIALGNLAKLVIGIPIDWLPHDVTWVCRVVLLVALLSIVFNWSGNPRLQKAILFSSVAFVSNLIAVFHGIGGATPGNDINIVVDMQYYLDPLIGLAIAVGIAYSPFTTRPIFHLDKESASEHIWKRHKLSRTTGLACGALLIVHFVLFPLTLSKIWNHTWQQRAAHSWMSNVSSSLSEQYASGGNAVIPLLMPTTFVPSFETPGIYQQLILPLFPSWKPSATAQVTITSATGTLVPAFAGNSASLTGAQLATSITSSIGVHTLADKSGGLCVTGASNAGRLTLVLPKVVSGGQLAADIHLFSENLTTLTISTKTTEAGTFSNISTSIPAGSSRLLNPLNFMSANDIIISGVGPGQQICISSIQVGAIETESSGPDSQCALVDAYGMPTGRVPRCGASWR